MINITGGVTHTVFDAVNLRGQLRHLRHHVLHLEGLHGEVPADCDVETTTSRHSESVLSRRDAGGVDGSPLISATEQELDVRSESGLAQVQPRTKQIRECLSIGTAGVSEL